MPDVSGAARSAFASVKAMVPGRFEAIPASEQTHPHVDWKAYHAVREQAASLGFRHLGDIDPISVWLDPGMMKRAVLAIFVSDDGTEVIGHYRIVLRWTFKGILARFFGGVRGNIFDISTNFGGGEGLDIATTTAHASRTWQSPDFIRKDVMVHGTPLENLVRHHRQRVQEHRSRNPTARPTVVRSLQDVVAVNDLMEKRKLAWRRELGWATRAELKGLSGALTDDVFEQFYQAFRTIADQER
jgi:hypothetical protein